MRFEAGHNIRQASERPGHGDPGFTRRTYGHLMDEGISDAELFDEVVRPTVTPPCESTPESPAPVRA